MSLILDLNEQEVSLPRLSPSQLGVFNRGECVWDYTYRQELKKKGPNPVFFQKGTYFHQLLHFYYHGIQAGLKLGSSELAEYMATRIKDDLEDINDENAEVMSSVVKMVNRYIARQSPQIDKNIYQILGVELALEYELVTPVGSILCEGYVDLVYRDKWGSVYVRDHKSGQKNSWFQSQVEMEPQLLFYAMMLHYLGYKNVKFAEINFANSFDYKKEVAIQDLFKLFRVEFSTLMLENFRIYIIQKATRILELRQDKKEPEKTFTKDCGKCDFRDICKAELRGQPTNGIITAHFDKVDRNKFRQENKTPDSPLNEDDSGANSDLFEW